ncbi:uncharacterized protein A4U43_C07F22250 [Asparagus officinalis]|uniref:DUF659 domain-containing protein n=1 Tax=Asparagus officinalis TaxID=4686 RepID=A0A5P1EFX9_ASPOF|nr:uncharacterized protein A4U43_C07F22250 [Asparagus officinalis]
MRQEVRITDEREEEAPELASICSKKPRISGPLDKMVTDGKMKQTVLNEIERRQWKDLAHENLSMWAYAAGLSFHVFDIEEFDIACEAIRRYGRGYKRPSQHQFRAPLLKKACDKIEGGLKIQKHWWDEYVCNILIDGWTNRRGLSWKIVVDASGANEDPRRSRMTFRRHATRARTDQDGSSSTAIDDMTCEGTNEDD